MKDGFRLSTPWASRVFRGSKTETVSHWKGVTNDFHIRVSHRGRDVRIVLASKDGTPMDNKREGLIPTGLKGKCDVSERLKALVKEATTRLRERESMRECLG
jgi:hypothetical protein